MVRGSGKFKTKRGGGRSFSRHMSLDENGIAVGTDPRKRKEESSEEDEDDDEDEDEDSEDEDEDGSDEQAGGDAAGNGPTKPVLTRTQRRELKRVSKGKQQQPKSGTAGGGEDDDDEEEDDAADLINPNHVKKKLNISDLSAPRELTRREREQKEKKEAQERYWKLHQQGKTDQAKMDLERLAKIRKEREEALAKRKAEQEEKAKEAEAKKAAQRSGKRA